MNRFEISIVQCPKSASVWPLSSAYVKQAVSDESQNFWTLANIFCDYGTGFPQSTYVFFKTPAKVTNPFILHLWFLNQDTKMFFTFSPFLLTVSYCLSCVYSTLSQGCQSSSNTSSVQHWCSLFGHVISQLRGNNMVHPPLRTEQSLWNNVNRFKLYYLMIGLGVNHRHQSPVKTGVFYMEFPSSFSLSASYIRPPLSLLHLSLTFCFLKVAGFYGQLEGGRPLSMRSFGLNLPVSFLNTDRKWCPWKDHYLIGKKLLEKDND